MKITPESIIVNILVIIFCALIKTYVLNLSYLTGHFILLLTSSNSVGQYVHSLVPLNKQGTCILINDAREWLPYSLVGWVFMYLSCSSFSYFQLRCRWSSYMILQLAAGGGGYLKWNLQLAFLMVWGDMSLI